MLLRGSPLEQSHFTNLSHQPHVPATRSTQPSSRADPFYTFDTNSSDWLKTDSGSAQPTADAADRAYTFENNPSSCMQEEGVW